MEEKEIENLVETKYLSLSEKEMQKYKNEDKIVLKLFWLPFIWFVASIFSGVFLFTMLLANTENQKNVLLILAISLIVAGFVATILTIVILKKSFEKRVKAKLRNDVLGIKKQSFAEALLEKKNAKKSASNGGKY